MMTQTLPQTLAENTIKRLAVRAVGLVGFLPMFIVDGFDPEGPHARTQRCLLMVENGQWRQTPATARRAHNRPHPRVK